MIVPLSLAEADARLEPDRIGPRIRRRERWLSLHLQELRRRDAALQDLRRPPGDVPRLSLRARRRLRVRLRYTSAPDVLGKWALLEAAPRRGRPAREPTSQR